MRKQPANTPPQVNPKKIEGVITQVREYQLITPLFGGGVIPGEADPVTIIRGTEIRGQLRFWWRACRAGQYGSDLTKMKQEEDKLWGTAYKRGKEELAQQKTTQITVEIISKGTSREPFTVLEGRKVRFNQTVAPSYVAFPLQPNQDDLKQGRPSLKAVQDSVSFRLTISFPADRRTDIEAALWAWETFGGIGARTRRGFGALRLLAVDGKDNTDAPSSNIHQVETWMKEKLIKFVANGKYPEDVPHLSQSLEFKVIGPQHNAMRAWADLINKLKSFRQNRPAPSGRSFWPEPEAIRRITHRRDTRYRELPHPQKFPRAVFGLPIIFHFKDKGDPEDTTLQGAEDGSDRLASPLIVRPLHCKDGQAIGLALLLEGPRISPGGLRLIEKNANKHPVDAILSQQEASLVPVLKGETDVLKAFMSYIGGNAR